MGRKIFVSNKYKDHDVKKMFGITESIGFWDYVVCIQKRVFYKGERRDEDISNWMRMIYGSIWKERFRIVPLQLY